ncbi:hypothetical protein IHQ68_03340 [Chelatococcus sambhunathii]|uniref:Uncharacterized protein n=1 Tax=Chelatococcus sambhunathii TaxID=363953 RepID=A0ABU1DC24_9HYPH|nr:hypothetical protein [Chelatococcus sambhunathii]MDR4305656.1 hypothetical protein [Chelatococcus sambhunathii]
MSYKIEKTKEFGGESSLEKLEKGVHFSRPKNVNEINDVSWKSLKAPYGRGRRFLGGGLRLGRWAENDRPSSLGQTYRLAAEYQTYRPGRTITQGGTSQRGFL